MARKEGTIEQRGPDKFLLRVYLRTEIATVKYGGVERTKPVLRYHSETFNGPRPAAKVRLRELLAMRDRGELGKSPEPGPDGTAETLANYLTRWLDLKRATIRENTAESYEWDVLRIQRAPIGLKPLTGITTLDVEEFYASLKRSVVRRTHVQLNGAMRRAKKMKLIAANPCEDAENVPAKAKAKPESLTAPEVARVLARLEGSEHRDPIAIMLATGMRECELLAIRWEDLSGGKIRIRRSLAWLKGERKGGPRRFKFHDPKTEKSKRTISLPASAVKLLAEHKRIQAAQRLKRADEWQDLGLVFCNEVGLPLHAGPINDAFKAAVAVEDRSAARELTLYKCRHTSASLPLAEGADASAVSERLGHSDVGFTLSTYKAVLPGQQEKAAEQLDALIFGTK